MMGAIDAGQCFNPTHPPNLFLLQIWSPPMLQQMGRERVKVTQQKRKKKFSFFTLLFSSPLLLTLLLVGLPGVHGWLLSFSL